MHRVVVTGMGLLTPLGCGISDNWQALSTAKSGIRKITHIDVSDMKCQIGGDILDDFFQPLKWVKEEEVRRYDDFITYGLCAAKQAIDDAGLTNLTLSDADKERIGVVVGSGIGGLDYIAKTSVTLHTRGPGRVSPFFIPGSLINLLAGNIAIKYDFRGHNNSVVTACATGAHAISDGARMIQMNEADIMVVGGAENGLCRIGIAGFDAMQALSTSFNHIPEQASRPWDKSRDGFVIGNGSGILVLERYEHAKARGSKIYAELLGYGTSCDAYHIALPNGYGASRAMSNALNNAKLLPEEIQYINAHGTSTPSGDEVEAQAIRKVFGKHSHKLLISSTKSATGHLLGAAGSVEAIFTILTLNNGLIPATLNLHDIDSHELDFVPLKTRKQSLEVALSNSFGFGGTNATLIFANVT